MTTGGVLAGLTVKVAVLLPEYLPRIVTVTVRTTFSDGFSVGSAPLHETV